MHKKRYGEGKRRSSLDKQYAYSALPGRKRGQLSIERPLQDQDSLAAIRESLAPYKENDPDFKRLPGRLSLILVSPQEVNRISRPSPVYKNVSAGRLANRLSDLSAEMFRSPTAATITQIARFGGNLALKINYEQLANERENLLQTIGGIMSVRIAEVDGLSFNPYIPIAESPNLSTTDTTSDLNIGITLNAAEVKLRT
jgi:hypothetical protein